MAYVWRHPPDCPQYTKLIITAVMLESLSFIMLFGTLLKFKKNYRCLLALPIAGIGKFMPFLPCYYKKNLLCRGPLDNATHQNIYKDFRPCIATNELTRGPRGPWVAHLRKRSKFHFKTYLLTPWPTYTTNWNGLNNIDREPHRDHSCEVWSNSHKWLKRRWCLKFSLYKSM